MKAELQMQCSPIS